MDESVWNENTLDEEERQKKDHYREITTHVSIHTIHLDGLRELYRQFLRLPDGAVVEVFTCESSQAEAYFLLLPFLLLICKLKSNVGYSREFKFQLTKVFRILIYVP